MPIPHDARRTPARCCAAGTGPAGVRGDRGRGGRATLAVALIGLAGAAWGRSGRSANAFPPLLGAGTAPDWRNSRLLLDVSGSRWGCLTSLPPEHRRLQVLLTTPSKVLEIDPQTGQIAPAKLSTKVFPDGRLISCPQTAPDGRGLLWARKNASNQREIWYSPSPDGEGGRLITRGTSPLWLPSGRDFVFNTDSGRLARGNLEGRTLLFDNEPVQSPDWMITAVDPGGKTVALFGSPFEGSNSGYVDIYDIARLTRTARHEIARRIYNGAPAFHPLTGRLQFPPRPRPAIVVESATGQNWMRRGSSRSAAGWRAGGSGKRCGPLLAWCSSRWTDDACCCRGRAENGPSYPPTFRAPTSMWPPPVTPSTRTTQARPRT